MAATEKNKSEVETANSQVGRLKQMHLNNLTIKQNRNAEIQDLRKQLQALEEKMAQLGIEKDKDEDKNELAEAIAMSETAVLIADTHALARVDKRLRVYIHYLRKRFAAAFQRTRNPRGGSLLLRKPPSGRGCRFVKDADLTGVTTPSPPVSPVSQKTDRFVPWLAGQEVPRVDCSSEAGFQEALRYVARRVPVVMLNLNLMPATRKWDVDYLRSHCNEWPGMNVLRSDGAENRYLYYVPEQADRDMSAFAQAPRHASADLRLSFENFVQRSQQDPKGCYYLQAPLVLRDVESGSHETWNRGLDSELRADCESRVDWRRLEALQAAGGFGTWARSQLFVGPNESLSPVHYDQYDNIYLQVQGEKRFLLFDPRCAEGLYPFPVSHPYDEYGMVDLEHPDLQSFPKLRSVCQHRGQVASVKKGEAIFIPTHWWHHVQGRSDGQGADGWSISVNFWFAIHKVLLEGPHPFPPHLELELARHVELLLSDVVGSASVGAAARDLVQEAKDETTASEVAMGGVTDLEVPEEPECCSSESECAVVDGGETQEPRHSNGKHVEQSKESLNELVSLNQSMDPTGIFEDGLKPPTR
eukprot:symbB.v1.2.008839.t1/scaffold550.1/size188255/3